MNTITLPLHEFLLCVTYHEPFGHKQVSENIAQAIRAADPQEELCHLEPYTYGNSELPYNLWTIAAWHNELQRRAYLDEVDIRQAQRQHSVGAAKASGVKCDARTILEQQLEVARRDGNSAMESVLLAAIGAL